MRNFKKAAALTMVVSAALLLGGCAGSYQARSVDLGESPLVNPKILVEGKGDQALYRYQKPNLDIKKYGKVIIDPVMIYKDGELDKDELANYQTLANNAFVYLSNELEKDYKIVKTPEPGTMRIQWAIVDADSSKSVRNTLSTFMPIGLGVSVVRLAATGKQTAVGEITTQIKFTDATSGELLGAALDRRVGGKTVTKLWSDWYNADEALKYWAKKINFTMCETRNGDKCIKPD